MVDYSVTDGLPVQDVLSLHDSWASNCIRGRKQIYKKYRIIQRFFKMSPIMQADSLWDVLYAQL